MLQISQLRKKFLDHQVLSGIDVNFQKGKVTAILGASGSGKSTLLRCLNGLEDYETGKIYLDGELVRKSQIHLVRAKVGMVFQNFNLFPLMTVLENLIYAPVKVKNLPRTEAIDKAKTLLKKVGLENRMHAYPRTLSGGEKQRIAIARTLMLDPEVILFDEPTSALDPERVQEVLRTIKDLSHTGITMLIVTHEMDFVKEVADRVLFLDNGSILLDCTPEAFFREDQIPRVQRFLALKKAPESIH